MRKAIFQLKNNPKIIIIVVGIFVYFPLWLVTIVINFKQNLLGVIPSLPVLGSDSLEYWNLALNIKNLHVFSLSAELTPEIFRVPGYPFFVHIILFICKSGFLITFAQIILTLLTAVIIYKIVLLKFGNMYGISSILLFLLEPSVVLHSLIILSDSSYLFLLVLSTYFLLTKEDTYSSFVTGCILGISVLFRPISIFLPILYCGWYIYHNWANKEQVLKKSAIFFFGFVITIIPWMWRNYVVFNNFSISTLTSYNLAYYNVPMFLSWKNSVSEEVARSEFFEKHGLNKENLKYPYVAASSSLAVKNVFQENLVFYAYFHIKKLQSFFFTSSIKNTLISYNMFFQNDEDIVFNGAWKGLIALERVVWLVMFLGVLASLMIREIRAIAIFFICLIGYFAVLTGPVSYARYRLPVEPYLFILVPMSFVYIKQMLLTKFK